MHMVIRTCPPVLCTGNEKLKINKLGPYSGGQESRVVWYSVRKKTLHRVLTISAKRRYSHKTKTFAVQLPLNNAFALWKYIHVADI